MALKETWAAPIDLYLTMTTNTIKSFGQMKKLPAIIFTDMSTSVLLSQKENTVPHRPNEHLAFNRI
jgi:hypothetical protein